MYIVSAKMTPSFPQAPLTHKSHNSYLKSTAAAGAAGGGDCAALALCLHDGCYLKMKLDCVVCVCV